LLKNHIGEIDEPIVELWRKLDATGNDNRKVDFEFLKAHKGKTQAQIDDIIDGFNTRLAKAKELEPTYPHVAEFLRKSTNSSTYRNNLINSIVNLYNKKETDLDEFINIYQKDPLLFNELNQLKSKPATQFKDELERIFSGSDFNAHHINPANLLYNNKVLQDILEWAVKNGKTFEFNDIDNLVFLRLVNHTDGVYGHKIYDNLIGDEISGLESIFRNSPNEAFNQLQNKIKKYQNGIKDQLIGTQKKLDNLDATQLR
jgi:hypothetical protein